MRYAANAPSQLRLLKLNNVEEGSYVRLLKRWGHWPNLESLSIIASRLDSLIESLVQRDQLTGLQSLCLINYDLSHDRFTAYPVNWSNLRELHLRSVNITDQGLLHLAKRPMSLLQQLRLPKCELHAAGVKAWFDQHPALELQHLELSGNDFSEPGGVWPDGLRVRHLELDDTMMGVRGLQALMEWPGFAHLESLDLSRNSFSDAAMDMLCERSDLNLRSLSLRGNNLKPGTVQRLFAWSGMARLENLELGGNNLPARAIHDLWEYRQISQLRRFHYQGNEFSNEAGRHIMATGCLDQLCECRLPGGQLSDEVIDALREHFGDRIHL